jgi:hypothetical protein
MSLKDSGRECREAVAAAEGPRTPCRLDRRRHDDSEKVAQNALVLHSMRRRMSVPLEAECDQASAAEKIEARMALRAS